MNASEDFTLDMHRHIRAPREKVYAAFTTATGLASWMGPRGMRAQEAQADARPGGPWRVSLVGRDGHTLAVGGRYEALDPHSHIAYSWKWEGPNSPMPGLETRVDVRLEARDNGTDLHMRHSGFPVAAARDGHHHGWKSTFNRLNDYLDPEGTAGTLTLLGDGRSTYTRTARLALAEKAIAYTHQPLQPHSPEVGAIHPLGRIPALRDGEFEIFETAAIVSYLDECFDTGVSLRPGSIIERTRCTQWISFVNCHLYDTMGRRYVLEYIGAQGQGRAPDRAIIDAALAEMPAQLAALDAACAQQPWLAGGSLSAADLFVAPILAYVERMPEGAALLAGYPNLMRSQQAMRQRPSYIATQA